MGQIQNSINSVIGNIQTATTLAKAVPAITDNYEQTLKRKKSYSEELNKIVGEEMQGKTISDRMYEKAFSKLQETENMMEKQRRATIAARGNKGSAIDKEGDTRKANNFAAFRQKIHKIFGGK